MENIRQQKVASQIKKDISDIFTKEAAGVVRGSMVTVTVVRVSPDLGYAKVYLSVFPFANGDEVLKSVEENNWMIRKALAARVKNQLRVVPELSFFLDDSLEYIENIESLIKE